MFSATEDVKKHLLPGVSLELKPILEKLEVVEKRGRRRMRPKKIFRRDPQSEREEVILRIRIMSQVRHLTAAKLRQYDIKHDP